MIFSHRRSSTLAWVFFACCFTTISLHGQQLPWNEGPLAGDPKAIVAAASSIAPDRYPYTTILLDEVRFSIDEGRRITRTRRFLYRIDSPKALQGWGRTSVYWEPWHQEKPVVKARVIGADGTVYLLDEKTLTDSPARQQSADVYTDTRYYGGPLPGIAVGAIVEEYNIRRDTVPFFDGGSVQRYTIGTGVPTAATQVIIEYPAALPLITKVVNLPNLKQRKEEIDGRIRLTFEHDRIEALPPVPEMVAPDEFSRGAVEFTTATSWKDVNEKYYRIVSGQMQAGGVADLVQQTVKKDEKRDITIAKLLSKLHAEVRYTGIEFGEAAIVPHVPEQTLQRHFGDCKDKALLLVAMLEAAGIHANLALVRTEKPDVDSNVPGLGLFDHAIVYVPGQTPMWVDATAEYNALGNVPAGIRGRQALVIDGKSDHLIRIPFSQANENRQIETREFFLADYGPAKVVETLRGTGFFDASYRSYFSGPAEKNRKESLNSYGRTVYLAESAGDPKSSDGRDLLAPFDVSMEFANARRGFTDIDEAVVAIRTDGLFSSLPRAFTTKDEKKKEDAADAEPRRTADYVFEPFRIEWNYKIHPPTGFRLHAAPAAVDRALGPARLTESWTPSADGGLEGVIRFDTVKGRYTVAEGEAARDAIVQAMNEPATMVRFDNVGAALIASGKIRDGLAEMQRTIAAAPKQPLHRVRLSRALLQAGLGEEARREAEAAVKLDDHSVVALTNLGWTLEHDILGRRFERGFDPEGAIAAYKKALAADPKDKNALVSLGIISEFNREGERYMEGSHLDQAIASYEALKTLDKETYDRFEFNLVLCQFYSRKFDDLLAAVGSRASTEQFRGVAIAATAAQSGSDAALLQASRWTGGQQERSTALRKAADLLIRIREYQRAADLLTAGLEGADNSANLRATVGLYRGAKKWESAAPDTTNPARAVHELFVALGTQAPEEEVTRHLSNAWQKAGTKETRALRIRLMRVVLMNALGDTGLPRNVVLDLTLSNTQYTAEGDEGTGYRVWVRLPDSEPQPVFVVKEEGAFRVLTFRDYDPLGWEALARLKSNHVREAAKLLDWARQQVERGDADDAIGGELFARVWEKNSGAHATREEVELGALALVLGTTETDLRADAEEAVRTLPEAKRSDAERLLWQADIDSRQWASASVHAEKLYKMYPHSDTAFACYAVSLMGDRRFDVLEKIARERLQADPDDQAGISMLTEALAGEDRGTAARDFVRERIRSGRAKADEQNNYAWQALFSGVDDEALEIARRSVAATNEHSYSVLHTLACLYAEVGKTAEARELILKAMQANYLEEMDSSLWYVYGRIAEQYGQLEAAKSAYERVEKPEPPDVEQISTYRLAMQRLAHIDTSKADAGTKRK